MPAPPPLPPAVPAPAPPAGIELVEVGDWDAGPKRSKWTPEVLNANTLLMPIELPAALGAGCASLLCGLLTRDASVRLGAGGAAEVMRHPWLRPVEFELLRRGVPLPAPFVPDSRLVYARDDLAPRERSDGAAWRILKVDGGKREDKSRDRQWRFYRLLAIAVGKHGDDVDAALDALEARRAALPSLTALVKELTEEFKAARDADVVAKRVLGY